METLRILVSMNSKHDYANIATIVCVDCLNAMLTIWTNDGNGIDSINIDSVNSTESLAAECHGLTCIGLESHSERFIGIGD